MCNLIDLIKPKKKKVKRIVEWISFSVSKLIMILFFINQINQINFPLLPLISQTNPKAFPLHEKEEPNGKYELELKYILFIDRKAAHVPYI